MKIKYIGGRSTYEVTLNRKGYYFNKENNRTLETKDQNLINYIFSLPNRAEFIAVEEPIEPPKENIVTKIVEVVKKPAGRPKKEGK